jgi:ribonuclease E
MSLEIVQTALAEQPIEMKEAFDEAMKERIAAALEEKYKTMAEKADDSDDSDEDDDEDEDEDDEEEMEEGKLPPALQAAIDKKNGKKKDDDDEDDAEDE